MQKFYIHFFLFFCFLAKVEAQIYEDILAPEYIKTTQIFNPKTNNQSPFFSIDDHFILSFDDLRSTQKTYYYFIKHYDRNWEDSALFETEYLHGFFTDQITDYTYSYNTYQPYIHYQLRFPNENMQLKVSGNYAIFIYTEDKNKPLFSLRFSIFENSANLSIQKINQNIGNAKLPNHLLKVDAYSNGKINLSREIQNTSLTLIKNNNWQDKIENIKPLFVENNRLVFSQQNLAFFAGNEFYFFDTKNRDVKGLTTETIIKAEPYEAILFLEHAYPTTFSYNPDVDGAFYIRRNDIGLERNGNIEADYIKVHFGIKMPELENKELYVVGSFNQYNLNESNKMSYHPEGYYSKEIILKQGYYNYQFVLYDPITNTFNDSLMGNFWETQNTYSALLYYRYFGDDYDRLISFSEIYD